MDNLTQPKLQRTQRVSQADSLRMLAAERVLKQATVAGQRPQQTLIDARNNTAQLRRRA